MTGVAPGAAPASAPQVVVIFCDVGTQYGVGHLMRCLALAEEFSARGTAVVFAADVAAVPLALAQVEARGFAHRPPPVGVEDHLRVLRETAATHAVIDSYHLSRDVYAAVTAELPTLALVDGDPHGRTAHVLVDQNIGAEDDDWTLPPGVTRLAGLDFALMRAEIRDLRPNAPWAGASEPPRVFAFFGGTDAFGAGPVLTAALVATGHPFDLRVVAPTRWELSAEPKPGQRIELIGPTDRLADEVRAADLVVSAAGTSSWELLCLGAACAFVCVAENQAVSYGRAVEAGLGLPLGMLPDLAAGSEMRLAEASRILARALADPHLRAGLREAGWRRVDGRGRERVADALLGIERAPAC